MRKETENGTPLTDHELRALELTSQGLSYKEVGEMMEITHNTVAGLMRNIRSRFTGLGLLNVQDLQEVSNHKNISQVLVMRAKDQGWLT